MEELRKEVERQRDLEMQSAGTGGSGLGAASSVLAERDAPVVPVAPVTGKSCIS